MKKYLAILALAGVCFSAVSCSYLRCALSNDYKACLLGVSIDKAVAKLNAAIDPKNATVDTKALASHMTSLNASLHTAKLINFELPDRVKNEYNTAINRIIKHDYYDSVELEKVFENVKPL